MVISNKRRQMMTAIVAVFSLMIAYLANVSGRYMGFYMCHSDANTGQQLVICENSFPTIDIVREELTLSHEEDSTYSQESHGKDILNKNLRIHFTVSLLTNMLTFSWFGILPVSELTTTCSQRSIIEYIHHKDGQKS